MMVWSLFIIGLMGLFFYNKIDSIIPIVVLPTTEIIEPKNLASQMVSWVRVELHHSFRLSCGLVMNGDAIFFMVFFIPIN